jgi:hypothetical protein
MGGLYARKTVKEQIRLNKRRFPRSIFLTRGQRYSPARPWVFQPGIAWMFLSLMDRKWMGAYLYLIAMAFVFG